MILSNILHRTFFIKAEQYGTAFTIDVAGAEYLVTARHLFDVTSSRVTLHIFHDKKWLPFSATIVGHGAGEIDISVLRLSERITRQDLVVTPSIEGLALGQDVFFLGFPFKMWSDLGSLMGGLPAPFAKKGTLSAFGPRQPGAIYVDAINNEGFSGGPLFFYRQNDLSEVRIAGVVSKFLIQSESVLDEHGDKTSMTVPYNTGFLIAYRIENAIDLIGSASK